MTLEKKDTPFALRKHPNLGGNYPGNGTIHPRHWPSTLPASNGKTGTRYEPHRMRKSSEGNAVYIEGKPFQNLPETLFKTLS